MQKIVNMTVTRTPINIKAKGTEMYERNQIATCAQVAVVKDPLEELTCGKNLERKIEDTKKRLAELEKARTDLQQTGLYDVKISVLRDTMSY